MRRPARQRAGLFLQVEILQIEIVWEPLWLLRCLPLQYAGSQQKTSKESLMKPWFAALTLVACISLVAFGRPNSASSSATPSEDDFRKMEQAWLDAAAVPDLEALRNLFSDDFMGTSFGGGVLSKNRSEEHTSELQS